MSKEVAKKEDFNVAVNGAELFNLKDNMEGVQPRLPQIGIVHQGQMFIMPDGEKTQKFIGIILDSNRINAFWHHSFSESGGGDPPDCFSMDGIVPEASCPDPQHDSCTKCPHNEFGSDGRGKACKNMKRAHVLLDDSALPYRLTIPPTSLKSIDTYVSLLTGQGVPYQLVITEIGLREVANKDGIKYSEVTFKQVGNVTTKEKAEQLRQARNDMLQAMRGDTVNTEEYMSV